MRLDSESPSKRDERISRAIDRLGRADFETGLQIRWAERWRRREAQGDMIVVRYADDRAPRRREEEALM